MLSLEAEDFLVYVFIEQLIPIYDLAFCIPYFKYLKLQADSTFSYSVIPITHFISRKDPVN